MCSWMHQTLVCKNNSILFGTPGEILRLKMWCVLYNRARGFYIGNRILSCRQDIFKNHPIRILMGTRILKGAIVFCLAKLTHAGWNWARKSKQFWHNVRSKSGTSRYLISSFPSILKATLANTQTLSQLYPNYLFHFSQVVGTGLVYGVDSSR